jgi:hypothetical protein
MTRDECSHGSLARSCRICELEAEVERLRKDLDDALVRNTEEQDEHSAQRAAIVKELEGMRKAFEALRAVAPTTAEVEGVLDDYDRGEF